jgi:hypothetical protein
MNRSKLARQRAGLSVGQAAILLGIEREHLVVIEEMDVQLADFDFTRMADTYGCRVEWIIGEVDQYDFAAVDAIDGADRLTPHDRKVIAEFVAMIPRKPAKTLAQVAAERGHHTVSIALHGRDWVQPLETMPEQFVVHCKCGWRSVPCSTEEGTAEAMAVHLVETGAAS